MNLIELTYGPIDLTRLLQAVSHPDAGGEVLFLGTTRRKTVRQSDGVETHTDFLVYEAYESMALRQLDHLVQQARQRWPIKAVAVVHRLGKVLPQEASIAIAVSTPHRADAFSAARWLIDNIKQEVPIWKQENFLDSAPFWVHPMPAEESQLALESSAASDVVPASLRNVHE